MVVRRAEFTISELRKDLFLKKKSQISNKYIKEPL